MQIDFLGKVQQLSPLRGRLLFHLDEDGDGSKLSLYFWGGICYNQDTKTHPPRAAKGEIAEENRMLWVKNLHFHGRETLAEQGNMLYNGKNLFCDMKD